MKIHEKHKKSPKMSKKHIRSKEKRPKAIDSSHNACRYGYPFFLSPSDDDAMLEIPNPTPSVHLTFCYDWSFFLCHTKRKETRLSKIPQQKQNSKTSEKRRLHIYPKSQKFQEYQTDYPKFSNHSKINGNL